MRWSVDHHWDGSPLPSPAATVTVVPQDDELLLLVRAPLRGDPPPPGPPGFTERLYEHEVVEWFLVGTGSPVPYLEVELGPHGHFLVLHLCGVRKVIGVERELEAVFGHDLHHWHAQARIERAWLPPGPHRANAFAMWGVGDDRTFAAAHPTGGPAPDFHRLEAFAPVSVPVG